MPISRRGLTGGMLVAVGAWATPGRLIAAQTASTAPVTARGPAATDPLDYVDPELRESARAQLAQSPMPLTVWASSSRAMVGAAGGRPAGGGSVKFNHIGIPTQHQFDGEIPLPHLQITESDHQNNPFGIQWQRYWDDAPYPELVNMMVDADLALLSGDLDHLSH